MILKNKIGENHLTSVELNPNTNKKSNYAIKDLKISQFRNYENLEYLGDAVINLSVANWLLSKNEHKNEGFLSSERTFLTNWKKLSAN